MEDNTPRVYDKKKVDIETPYFKGTARIRFNKVLKGKHSSHEYTVAYDGHLKTNDKRPVKGDEYRMVVNHTDGKPYSHKMHSVSSKRVVDLIKKVAPTFVAVSELKPR